MATILDLPRELYLIICSNLSPTDLTRLAGVSRDHYLTAQGPLFSRIHLTSFSALVKLVGTLMKVPVVSQISPKQRLHWHKLSDAQLCERDIRQLDLVLDIVKDASRMTGVSHDRAPPEPVALLWHHFRLSLMSMCYTWRVCSNCYLLSSQADFSRPALLGRALTLH